MEGLDEGTVPLVVPRPEEDRDFAAETALRLIPDPAITLQVDLSTKVQALESSATGVQAAQVHSQPRKKLSDEGLRLVDWEQAYLALLEYKANKGWSNLVIQPETPRAILERVPYTLEADEAVFHPSTFQGRARLQEAVTTILCRYVDAFYRRAHERWDSLNLVYRPVDSADPNLAFRHPGVQESKATYTVRVPRSHSDLIGAIGKLGDEMDKLIKEENACLPRVNFDRHLYLPLLIKRDDVLTTDPPALEESETRFVRDLKAYWEAEREKSLAGREVFLLRNLSRGKGVGFFEERGFYPDFILWIVDGQGQRIVFVEPHGMVHATAYMHDDKARLWEHLPDLAKEIGQRTGRHDIVLDSYIISATPYDDLYRHYDDGSWTRDRFAEHHILFQERNKEYDYVKTLLSCQ